MTSDYQREREDALAHDAMTQGEYTRMALNQYASAYGEADQAAAWILSPFDSWERNPHYRGPPVHHPEMD